MEILTISWKGQDRRIVREAHAGDKGFDPEAEQGSQVVVKMGGGEEIVIPKEGDNGTEDATRSVDEGRKVKTAKAKTAKASSTSRASTRRVKRILPNSDNLDLSL